MNHLSDELRFFGFLQKRVWSRTPSQPVFQAERSTGEVCLISHALYRYSGSTQTQVEYKWAMSHWNHMMINIRLDLNFILAIFDNLCLEFYFNHSHLCFAFVAMAWLDDLIWRLRELKCPKDQSSFIGTWETCPTQRKNWWPLFGYLSICCHSPSAHHPALFQDFAWLVLLITWMGFDLTQEMCGRVELLEFSIYHAHLYKMYGKNTWQAFILIYIDSWCGGGMVLICCNVQLQCQEVDYMEFFAGVGNLTSQMKSAMYRAARFDIKDHTPRNKRSNYMDMNSPAGYAFLSLKF